MINVKAILATFYKYRIGINYQKVKNYGEVKLLKLH